MLALSPFRNPNNNDESRSGGGGASTTVEQVLINDTSSCGFTTINPEEFPEFADHGNLLDSIDFDDLFGGDSLPDLEIDPEILSTADFSDHVNSSSSEGDKCGSSKRDDNETASNKKRKYSSPDSSKTTSYNNNNRTKTNNEGKRKVKVDWTAELHRRFVDAVEQLGVDKAVPSRILELMNVHSLTRHNVASHLQKYRSHRKHLLAREAEAANWTLKRQMYGTDAVSVGRKNGGWLAPIMGFPPPPSVHTHFRPLHVWGHPTAVDLWPKHTAPPSVPHGPHPHPPFWGSDPPFWHRIPNGTTPGTPCFPATPPTTRFGPSTVAGIPQPPRHHTVQSGPPPPLDLHPSKESVDAAIGDVLRKPSQPLPLGLKPPSVDSVMTELHRHGVSHVPPTAPCA